MLVNSNFWKYHTIIITPPSANNALSLSPPVTMAPALLVENPSCSGGCACSPSQSTGAQKITSTAPSSLPDTPCRFNALCHPLEESITKEVDGWFLAHWPFATAKDRKKFVASAFSQVTCLYFPLAKDDRIRSACELLTILFLIDGKCTPYERGTDSCRCSN